jgi:hypothetical protein
MDDKLLTDRRDLVIDRLSSGYAQGLLEVEELERRLVRAHDAQSPRELDELVTDLAPSAATTALVLAQRTRVTFGSVERTGPWAVPQQLSARVLCGHLLLDLREARLDPGVTTIEVHVTMGNVEVIVPPGVEVDVRASSFLGNAEERIERTAGVRGPVVQIVGRVRLGNLEVETRRPGETARDARRRRRSERRAYRRWRHARERWMW